MEVEYCSIYWPTDAEVSVKTFLLDTCRDCNRWEDLLLVVSLEDWSGYVKWSMKGVSKYGRLILPSHVPLFLISTVIVVDKPRFTSILTSQSSRMGAGYRIEVPCRL